MSVKFSLINNLGQEYQLNDVNGGALLEVTGVGGRVENTYSMLNNTWVRMSSKSSQPTISGYVAFHNVSVYEKEAEFSAFMRIPSSIKLKMQTPVTTKYLDVDIVSYEMSAIGLNTLYCPIQMMGTSLWYTPETEKANIIVVSGNEFRFPVTWPARLNDYSDGYITINNNGSVEASFEVEFYGACDNPEITLEVEDVEVSKVEITASIVSGEKIFYSSKDGALCCFKGSSEAISEYKRTGSTSGLTNLALGFSLSNENFFKIPVGASKLHITADSTLTNPIMVSIYKFYRSV